MIILITVIIIKVTFLKRLLYAKCFEYYFVYSSQQPHFTDEKLRTKEIK